jgi:ribosome assembly protein YihI (activator of Der GTPase)
MNELETKLINLLKLSEAESKERENRLLERIENLQRLVLGLAVVVDTSTVHIDQLADQYNKVVDLLNEELQ